MTKKRHSPALKTKVVIEALKGHKTTAQLASQYQVHPVQIRAWKAEALKNLEAGFTDKRHNQDKQQQQLVEELYRQIGQLKVELDWLKKKTCRTAPEPLAFQGVFCYNQTIIKGDAGYPAGFAPIRKSRSHPRRLLWQ